MKSIPLYLSLAFLLFAFQGCVSTSPGGSSNQSDFRNPDPEIERIHVEAYNLDLGIGVTQDRQKANELYLIAALAGDPRSMLNLGLNLIGGEGIEKNEVEGFAWIDAARFFTQHSPDMKAKWRIREAYDHYSESLPPQVIEAAGLRTNQLVEQIRSLEAGRESAPDRSK